MNETEQGYRSQLLRDGKIIAVTSTLEIDSSLLPPVPRDREFRIDYSGGWYQVFEGIPRCDGCVTLTSPVLEGSIYDREGAD
jgi:hypothetical protein